MKLKLLVLLMISVCTTLAISESTDRYKSSFGLRITPGADLPLAGSERYFEPGLLARASFLFTPEPIYPFNISASMEYGRNTRYGEDEQFLSKFALTAGGGVNLKLLPWLSFFAGAEGGYSVCMMDTDDGETGTAGIPVVTVTAGPSIDFLPALSLNINASYQAFLGLSNSLGISAGLTYRFKDKLNIQGRPILEGLPPKIINLEFDEIFPVFYKYYDDNPAGTAIILNPREDEITDISLDFYVNQYMDSPKRCTVPETLAPGETGNVDIMALFNNSVLGITEGTKVAAELTLNYKIDGVQYTDAHSETMRMQYRNAMTWDDDRRAAAFVTAKDPAIMGFAKNVASMLHESRSSSINKNLQQAIAIHNALTLYGLTYVIDPTTSYADLSSSETAIDFLQFPRETLEYRAGDCDDLSILHCALFEALGMETAFITVPGHIFMAFALGIPPAEASRTFYNRENLIVMEGKVWIPMEITALKDSFIEAWDLGARQWNEHNPTGKTGFFPIRTAWQYYEPVGLPGEGGRISMPPVEKVVEIFQEELSVFISREMNPQIERYKGEIERNQGRPKSYNKLGVLYARYGQNDEAVKQFESALENEDYFPALLNLGNINFIEDRMDEARGYYSRAQIIQPENPSVNLCLARTSHSLGDAVSTSEYYEIVKNLDSELAARFSYLDSDKADSGSRASNINDSEGIVLWEEEEEE
ncbi:MAG: hypothetical protein JEY99_21035 [Spirochaetales bacterium]|nr:hypothetical protein [Spirochaetales bacterium]